MINSEIKFEQLNIYDASCINYHARMHNLVAIGIFNYTTFYVYNLIDQKIDE